MSDTGKKETLGPQSPQAGHEKNAGPSPYSEHERGDSHWSHSAEKTKNSVLGLAVALTLTFSFIELIGGFWSNSLALIGDAGHMVTDSASLLFALLANKVAQRGADRDHSFGHGRIEVLAAFVNGLVMLGVVCWIFKEAVSRFTAPQSVAGQSVMLIAFVGLVINIAVAWSLSRDQKNVNTRAALLHVMGDLLGSLAAIFSGAIIWAGGPVVIDPFLSILVGVLLLRATWHILRDASRVLLEGVPEGIDYDEVGDFLSSVRDVNHVHDLHVWTMSPGHGAIQCHMHIESPECWPRILNEIRRGVRSRFGIDHITIQPEWKCDPAKCADCGCENPACPEDCGCASCREAREAAAPS